MKQKFLEWEVKYWFTPYAYAFVLYLLMTGMLANAKIITSSLGIFFTLSIRVTPIFFINAIIINSLSLETNQKNPKRASHIYPVWRLLIKRSFSMR